MSKREHQKSETKPKRHREGGVEHQEFHFQPHTSHSHMQTQLHPSADDKSAYVPVEADHHLKANKRSVKPSSLSSSQGKPQESLLDIRYNQRANYLMSVGGLGSQQTLASLEQMFKDKVVTNVNTTLCDMHLGKTNLDQAADSCKPDAAIMILDAKDKGFTQKQLIEQMVQNSNSTVHKFLYNFAESRFFSIFILVVILLNTVLLVVQTYDLVSVVAGWYFSVLEAFFLAIYSLECVIKIYVYRLYYFKEGWNILDFLIIITTAIDFSGAVLGYASRLDSLTIFRVMKVFKSIRALRALRVLRTIRFLANLQVIMTTCLQSMQSMGAIVSLMTLFMYMFAVIGIGLYSDVDREHFGNLAAALFTLFQILTLDDWFFIYTEVKKRDPNSSHILVFLIIYIVVEYFIFLNLFVAVLVDNFQLTLEAAEKSRKKKKAAAETDYHDDEQDDLFVPSTDSEVSYESLDQERIVFPRRPIQEYYPHLKQVELDVITYYFQILTSLEYNHSLYKNEYETIRAIVDLCVDNNHHDT